MRSSLLSLCLLPLVFGSSCPSGLELVRDGQCRGVYDMVNASTNELIDSAIASCNEIQAQPVIIHTEEQQSYWTERALGVPNDNFVIGLVCDSVSQKWQWADGSAVDFKPPKGKYSSELDGECVPGCSWTLFPDSNGGTEYIYNWYKNCAINVVKSPIFCVKQLEQPKPSGDGCESLTMECATRYVGATTANWKDALALCKQFGAELASVHNQQENAFLRCLAVSRGAVNGLFLGATIAGKGKDFGWADGTEWDYANFYSGFPIPGYGDCLAMDTSSASGQWMNFDCSAQLPVACVRKQNPDAENAVPTCITGPYEEGVIITSPGFPFSASTPCNFFLTVDAGKQVEAKFLQIEANSCCDSVTLYDGFLGWNVIANFTGSSKNMIFTSTTNSMKVVWQPNGSVNVMGFMITAGLTSGCHPALSYD